MTETSRANCFLAWMRRYRIEIAVFCAVFFPRFIYSLAVFAHSGAHGFVSFSDAETFFIQAKNLLERGVISRFETSPFLPDPLRTPFYIWFLAALAWLKFSLFGVVTVQNMLAASAGVLIYRIGKRFFYNGWAGFLAAALFAVEPMSIYWSSLLMSDNLFAFLFLVAVYLFLGKRWYFGTAALGLLTLTRPVGLYFLPLFLAFASIMSWRARPDWRRLLLRSAVMVALFSAIIFPWLLRNKVEFDRWGLSTAGWLNLYLFSMKEFATPKGVTLPLPPPTADYHPSLSENKVDLYQFESADFFKERSKELISAYPFSYLAFHLGSGIQSMNNHDYQYLLNYVAKPELPQVNWNWARYAVSFGQAAWLAVYLFSLIGLFLGGNTRVKVFLLALFIFNNLLIGYNGVISSGGRYNLAFVPQVLLLGVLGFMESLKWVRGK